MHSFHAFFFVLSFLVHSILYMAKRKKKKKKREPFFDDVSPQTKQAIAAIGFVALGLFFVLSSLGSAGRVGDATHHALRFLFGYGFVLAPIVCGLYVYILLKPREDERVSVSKAVGIVLLFLTLLGLFALLNESGGIIGEGLAGLFRWLIGFWAAFVVLVASLLVGIFLFFNTGFKMPAFLRAREREEMDEDEYDLADVEMPETEDEDEEEEDEEESEEDEEEPTSSKKRTVGEKIGLSKTKGPNLVVSNFSGHYEPPPLSLLKRDRGKANVGDVKANSNIIKRTLQKFKIDVEMDEVTIGSSVTRYAIKPAEGIRLERIASLQNNLEYALAASPIRIEAPIPGKSLVGIEVPNAANTTVGLASLLASPEYTDSPKPLLVALGRDITGNVHFANIARMPHGLIAGTTGSGKSVAIHNIIVSLLFRNSPEQLRFIMIDPKRLELPLYNGIPHLLTPVITDAKKAILSLKWAVKEMERRLGILESEKIQNLATYHETIYRPAVKKSKGEEGEELPEPLPYIVIVIDELADLMTAYPRELEALVVRLAQMSRAVGIHLILSTQRPSVNIITGTIKANVPTRVALQAASQVDSRTILDQAGAEKLLGKGDMLFLSAESPKPVRLQSAFISAEEVKKVVNYLKNQDDLHELDSIDFEASGKDNNTDSFFGASLDDDDDDDLYEEARDIVVEAGKASTSYLQRKLRIGYSRAARLMDMLEERSVIGPADGSRPREVLEQDETTDDHDDED
jgi:S-DNA-T family DNA segregation ATPase FtsK/SpoIIIE